MTHPALTPAHDFKALREAVGVWAACGWQVRDDQSDPPPDVDQSELEPPLIPGHTTKES